jgi:hypothetical protein
MATLLEQMRRNPSGDWRIADIEKLCRSVGAICAPPKGGGSHYKISHGSQAAILTIPYRRPIKPVYIRKLVGFIEAVQRGRTSE